MSEEVTKDDVICPRSLTLGWVQNYRVKYNPTKGNFTSRVVKTDRYYKQFLEANGGKTSYTFTLDEGHVARNAARDAMMMGDMRAPNNWDEKWKGEYETTLQDLKVSYPGLYGTTKTLAAKNTHPNWTKEAADLNEKQKAAVKKAELLFEELVTDNADNEEQYYEEEFEDADEALAGQEVTDAHEKSFAVTAVPTLEDAAQVDVANQPLKPQIHVNTFMFIDPDGNSHDYYLVKNKETGQWNAYEVGMNQFPSKEVTLNVKK